MGRTPTARPTARTRAPRGRARPAGAPADGLYTVSDLEQIKVLADPLRIRIMELLCEEERTTKQVAGILRLPPTRLYHHVAALEKVGLVRLTRTRQSRGALEKYYVAVAKAFTADPKLFSPATMAQASQVTQDVAVQLLEKTASDLRALLTTKDGARLAQGEGVLSYLEIRDTPKNLAALRARIMRLIKDCTRDEDKRDASRSSYRLTIAYFPVAKPRRS